MHLPIGISDFRELIESKDPEQQGYLYIDKTNFIKEIIYNLTKVIIITRPRRFGKTLNLSMLQYFFASEVDGQLTKGLFNGLEISKDIKCMKYQGKYPIIFISFKDIKQPNFTLCLEKIGSIIAGVYRKHRKVLESNKMSSDDRLYIEAILNEKATRIQIEGSIKRLLELLFQYYNERPLLLIDEYDTPIQEAYLQNYYQELMPFFRNFLSEPLKDDTLLNRAVLTGILRVSKESLFSGLNNVEIYSIFNKKYANYFGFLDEETNDLFLKAQLPATIKQTKEWYNGYNFDGITIYNPWSIIKCIKEKGKLMSYWVNTSGNELIKNLIIESSYNLQADIAELIAGNIIQKNIDEHIVFNDLKKNPESVWSLLLMSGYLKYTEFTAEEDSYSCKLALPNNEVENFYISVVKNWLTGDRGLAWYRSFLDSLTNGLIIEFEEKLQTFISETLSFHDVTQKSQEYFYHALLLGLTAGLKGTHFINSNKESGKGRYDISITPKDPRQLGIIIELKAIDDHLKLEATAAIALEQIKTEKYATELQTKGITSICLIGIACSGKSVKIMSSKQPA